MHEGSMSGCTLGPAPFFDHLGCDLVKFLQCARLFNIRTKLKAVSIGVEEIDGLEKVMVGWADNIQAGRLNVLFGGYQIIHIANFKCDMLHPGRCVFIAPHRR